MKIIKSPVKLGGTSKSKQQYCNSASSQRARLLDYFKSRKARISAMQARITLGILHPAGRVSELRHRGHKIDLEWIYEKDANQVAHRVGLYVYQGAPNE